MDPRAVKERTNDRRFTARAAALAVGVEDFEWSCSSCPPFNPANSSSTPIFDRSL